MGGNAGGWSEALPPLPDQESQTHREELFAALDRLFADPRREPSAVALDAACRGDVAGLYAWCAETFRFLLVTSDLADALAAFLNAERAVHCVEVGAGRGDLAAALARRGVTCIATDDASWSVRPRATAGIYGSHVQRLSHRAALDVLEPDTVICGWMPHHEDWTSDFRSAPSVERYVLIGTGPGGHVGMPMAWGEQPGWTRRELPDVAVGARCRIDALLDTPFARLHTVVVAYRRFVHA